MEGLGATVEVQKLISDRAGQLRHDMEIKLWKQTDRLFAVLLAFQWLAGIALALWMSPRAWEGLDSRVHPHIWAAVFVGGAIAACPIMFAIVRPGEAITRYLIGTAQMLHSAMLIHLSGGRIETHFHVFGSLAFLSFYRDWRVLVPATVVVALDHAARGIFWPESVFGIAAASPWRWTEHAGWVVFEDIILVWSCLRGAKELGILALRQAELEATNARVEAEVNRQTQRLEAVSQELIATARRAGMADIATGVLHNVGNVLNSVNVSTNLAMRKLKESEVSSLVKVGDMLEAHLTDLPTYLASDSKGKLLPKFLIDLAGCLCAEQKNLVTELQNVATGIDHIKEIVGAQQRHAKQGNLREKIAPAELFENTIAMGFGTGGIAGVKIVREFEQIEPAALDKHKVLQILINLLTNAKKSVNASDRPDKIITLAVRINERFTGPFVCFEVKDNGVGIAPNALTKIFAHGFTTRADGHGFGLHSAANAAAEMGGKLLVHSDGVGRGATFTLEVPAADLSSAEKALSHPVGTASGNNNELNAAGVGTAKETLCLQQ
jgi:signal transduction histidine kinase